MPGFWEVMDRCDRGPLHREKQYDMQLARAARKQAEAFDIRFDPRSVIPDDDDMAAGMQTNHGFDSQNVPTGDAPF